MGCEKDATIEVPKTDPTLGLACFITPGEEILATLTEVSPIYGGPILFKPQMISNAMMYMSDGKDTVRLIADSEGYKDASGTLAILPGKSYWIWADAPGYSSISASCTVPDYKVTTYSIDFNAYPSGHDSAFQVIMEWMDKKGQENFYRVQAFLVDSNGSNFASSQDLIFNQYEYRNDSEHDGERLSNFPNENMYQSLGQASRRYVEASLLTVDENYYNYHMDLINYQEDNPFAEPVQLYSNVNGGSGVFAGYLIQRQLKRIF